MPPLTDTAATCKVQDAGDQIALTDDTASLHAFDLDELRPISPATSLVDTSSLSDTEKIIERITGISELRYETRKADRRAVRPRTPRHYSRPRTGRPPSHASRRLHQHAAPLRTHRSHHPRRLRGTWATPRPAPVRQMRTLDLPRQLLITAQISQAAGSAGRRGACPPHGPGRAAVSAESEIGERAPFTLTSSLQCKAKVDIVVRQIGQQRLMAVGLSPGLMSASRPSSRPRKIPEPETASPVDTARSPALRRVQMTAHQ